MAGLRRCIIPVLLATLLVAAAGCGARDGGEEAAWRREADSSLRALEDTVSCRYRIHLETWIGVSGQSVYGDERGDGLYRDGDFSVAITRTSPEGEERLDLSVQGGEPYLRAGDAWTAIDPEGAPSPLYDPRVLVKLAASYGSISLQGEEERSGVSCRRYLMRLDSGMARDTLTETAWEYFSSLSYDLSCTLWVGDAAASPLALQVEVVGSDPQESLQRYRSVASVDFSDLDSPDIQPASPGE